MENIEERYIIERGMQDSHNWDIIIVDRVTNNIVFKCDDEDQIDEFFHHLMENEEV